MSQFNSSWVFCLREIREVCDTARGAPSGLPSHVLSEVAVVMASSCYTGCD